jgi:hypothetical protein
MSVAQDVTMHRFFCMHLTIDLCFDLCRDGFVDTQTAVYECTAGAPGCNLGTSGEPEGAIRVIGCHDITIRNCTFVNIGAP